MTYTDQLHLARHKQYEQRFSVSFQRVLKQNYYQIARNLEDGRNLAEIDSEPMQKVYHKLYGYIMITEGPLIWNELVYPLTGQEITKKDIEIIQDRFYKAHICYQNYDNKDIFDEVASNFAPDKMSEMKGFWKGLMTGYLNTYIIQRVTEVMGTTLRRVDEFIQKQRNGGLTDKEIARMLRADARARELRANTIARTEATNAMSKSQILALESSGLNWQKSWNAIRDDRTRDAHWVVSPTNWVGIKDNFIIGGFTMGYPGDLTQGSELKNVVNCRCYLRFRLAGRNYGFRPVQRRN